MEVGSKKSNHFVAEASGPWLRDAAANGTCFFRRKPRAPPWEGLLMPVGFERAQQPSFLRLVPKWLRRECLNTSDLALSGALAGTGFWALAGCLHFFSHLGNLVPESVSIFA